MLTCILALTLKVANFENFVCLVPILTPLLHKLSLDSVSGTDNITT